MEEIFDNPEKYIDVALQFGINVIAAIAVLILGLWLIKLITGRINKMMKKRDLDEALRKFLKAVISTILKIALIITIISQLGVETTSFVALLGAAGLAVGMALSGTLQNFAGGVMILLFKPFHIGDYIAAQGHEGVVTDIQIFNTILLSVDNKKIIIPNGPLSTNSMVNVTAEKTRRGDWTSGGGYGDSQAQAREVILEILSTNDKILQDPAVFVELSELADSSVNFAVRAWVKTEDYWDVYFDINKKVYETFDSAGLNIPYPQMDLHVYQADKS